MNYKKIFLLLLLFFTSSLFSQSAVVFMYHRFGEVKYPSTNIRLEQFEQQLNYLEKHNYNVWHLSKVVNHIINKKTIPPNTVALTIDDAYISAYTEAYPMLKSKNFPFTIFLSTNPVDHKSKFYMSWEMMREMQSNGAEFANHSQTHPFLLPQKGETEPIWTKRVTQEIENAQLRLQEEFGENTNENPRLFSYPFGEYNLKITQIVQELGYIGITQTSGPIGESSDLKTLSRFPMAEAYANPKGFITKLNTLPMPIESISPKESVIKGENPPKLRIKLKRALKHLRCYISSGEPIELRWLSQTEFEVTSDKALQPPRDKYTCTAPTKSGKWYWYSKLWIINK